MHYTLYEIVSWAVNLSLERTIQENPIFHHPYIFTFLLLHVLPSAYPLSSTYLPRPNLRPRTRIRSLATAIRIHGNPRITLRRIPRNGRQIIPIGVLTPTTRHHNLRTHCIKLRRLGLVQRQQLVPHEVVPRSEGGRDRGFPVEVLEDESCAPVVAGEGRGCHAELVDL